MRSRLLCIGALAMALSACYREERPTPAPPPPPALAPSMTVATQPAARLSDVQPGAPQPARAMPDKYENNAYALSQGKSLFRKFNCSGCHGEGGGGMGPALMNDTWIYGSAPANVYATIVEGRPNGMPSFGGHLTNEQVWQLVAYVRSMSGQVREDAAPSRSDEMQTAPPEGRRDRATPKNANDAAGAPQG